jgi:hypothetical protein
MKIRVDEFTGECIGFPFIMRHNVSKTKSMVVAKISE